MKTVKVLPGQTMLDIAIQWLGDTSRALEVAVMNEKNITDELIAGSYIKVPDPDSSQRSIVNFFTNSAFAPASNITEEDAMVGEGIGFWIIETDSVVQ